MFSDYRIQMDEIMKNTEKEESGQTPDRIAAVAMYKIMTGAISKFVEKESSSSPEFDAALSLEWKSAGRMLKHIWSNAEKMALNNGRVASCCLPEEVVYAWVRGYYFLDDRETVMKERAEQAKAEQKRREAKAKEDGYRKKALEILGRQNGWDDLPDDEKQKKITAKIRSLKAGDSRKAGKTAAKAGTVHSETAKESAVSPVKTEKADASTTSDTSRNNGSGMYFTENSAELEVDFANTLDGQMNLFNFI